MKPAKIAVQEAMLDRLRSDLSATIGTDWTEADSSMPFVELGDDDEVTIRETTNSEHSDVPHTIRCRAYTELKSKELSRDAAESLTDRSNKLSLKSPFHLMRSEVVGSDQQRQRRTRGRDIFVDVLIIQHRVCRS